MADELFQPSLISNEDMSLKTYDISKLFFVAFFGGLIPTVVLGTKNAKWLRLEKKYISIMLAFGGVLLLTKVIATGMLVAHLIQVSTRTLRLIFRVGSILVFLGYNYLMKNKVRQHQVLNGTFEPMLGEAVKWTVIGIIIETGLFALSGAIFNYVV